MKRLILATWTEKDRVFQGYIKICSKCKQPILMLIGQQYFYQRHRGWEEHFCKTCVLELLFNEKASIVYDDQFSEIQSKSSWDWDAQGQKESEREFKKEWQKEGKWNPNYARCSLIEAEDEATH